MNGKLETIYGYELGDSALGVVVMSTGCTRPEDFAIEVRERGDRCELKIYRQRPDRCRRAPMLKQLVLEWTASEACRNRELILMNPQRDTSEQKFR